MLPTPVPPAETFSPLVESLCPDSPNTYVNSARVLFHFLLTPVRIPGPRLLDHQEGLNTVHKL
jgi:hypothetical protein